MDTKQYQCSLDEEDFATVGQSGERVYIKVSNEFKGGYISADIALTDDQVKELIKQLESFVEGNG